MPDKKTKVILFGAGSSGEGFLSNANNQGNYEVIAIADNNVAKQGTFFYGYPVVEPAKILELEYDLIIITSGFAVQIKEQLINELSVDSLKIVIPPKRLLKLNSIHMPFEDQETLEVARDILFFIIQLFDDINITYFVNHGTLLGIVRDGDLISWDDDIDVSIYAEDMEKALLCLKDKFSKYPNRDGLLYSGKAYYYASDSLAGIEIIFKHVNSKMLTYEFPVSIQPISFEGDKAILPITYAPGYHFKTCQKVNFKGRMISVPYDYEKYLEFCYGDWKVPKRDMTYLDIFNMKKDWTINTYNVVSIFPNESINDKYV